MLLFGLFFVVMVVVGSYIYKHRSKLDEMHGMMAGMTFGVMAGLVLGTFYLIPTGNFLFGIILGSIFGLLFGIPLGKFGGHLGIMEGVMAGPMGGIMGAMLGQMVRPFDLHIFMPFFTLIFLITMFGLSYMVNCKANCCSGDEPKKKLAVSKFFVVSWIIASVILLSASYFLQFSIEEVGPNNSLQNYVAGQPNLPPFLQELTKEVRQEAVLKGDHQEIDLRITASRYYPNVIVAKKNIPLRINATSDLNVGCGREVVFPDFNIDRIVPEGTSITFEILPKEEGSFKFRCSMDMLRGELIVVS